jgi:hypothetical protein
MSAIAARVLNLEKQPTFKVFTFNDIGIILLTVAFNAII